jgi:hypothetical protein
MCPSVEMFKEEQLTESKVWVKYILNRMLFVERIGPADSLKMRQQTFLRIGSG